MLIADINCATIGSILGLLKHGVMPLIQIGIPIILIVFAVIDLGKAVISTNEDDMKKAQSILIKRFIYSALVFMVVWLVGAVMDIVSTGADDGSDLSGIQCWKNA